MKTQANLTAGEWRQLRQLSHCMNKSLRADRNCRRLLERGNPHRARHWQRVSERWVQKALDVLQLDAEMAAYEKFKEECVKDCRCEPPWECPCAGVLAGGFCDEMKSDHGPGEEDDV